MNNSFAYNKLRDANLLGNGVNKDYIKTKENYEISENLGNSEAFIKLGNLYFFEYGVKKDYKKAREYYEIAAK